MNRRPSFRPGATYGGRRRRRRGREMLVHEQPDRCTRSHGHGRAWGNVAAGELARYWWLWLVTGIAWLVAALVVLQFDSASVTTIGILVGIMFMFSGSQQLVLAFVADSLRWLWAIFG